jgi:hypothetical protein
MSVSLVDRAVRSVFFVATPPFWRCGRRLIGLRNSVGLLAAAVIYQGKILIDVSEVRAQTTQVSLNSTIAMSVSCGFADLTPRRLSQCVLTNARPAERSTP